MKELDHAVFRAINGLQPNAILDPFFQYGTELGTVWYGSALALVMYALATRGKTRDWRRIGFLAGVAFLVGVINQTIKFLVARPRPPAALPDVHVLGTPLIINSFPSGHTATVFAILAIFVALDRRLGLLWLPLALLVGFSRIYVGAHFPSDVLAGALLGFFGVYPIAKRVW